MILKTVQSLRSNWPRIVWYLATRPFCSRNPNATPVSRPRRRSPGGSNSNMGAPLLPEDQESGRDRHGKSEQDERPALHRELQATAYPVSAGAASGDARAED